MNLDDYVKREEEQRRNALPNWANAFYDIDTLNVKPSKKELIKSFNKYINCYTPTKRPNYSLPHHVKLDSKNFPHQIMQQIKSTDNKSMLIIINMIDSQDEWATSFITEEEYKKRINKYEQVGSQAFYELNLYNIFHINQTFVTYEEEIIQKCGSIFFSMDGKAFIKPKLSKELSKITDNQLGEILAQKAVELKQKVYKK